MFLKSIFFLIAVGLSSANELRRPEGRIIGGTYVPIEDVPWQVALLVGTSHICGGSIYNKWTILTAAHCVYGEITEHVSIRAGSSLKNFGGQHVNVSKIIIHEEFNKETLDNDIALLILEKPLDTNNTLIKPIELAQEPPSPGTNVLVTGWGSMYSKPLDFYPQILLGVNLTVVDTASCREKYNLELPKPVVCAHQSGKDSCQGDSGGPLVTWPNPKLVGIVSGGPHNCATTYPGFYTDVASFRDWILKTINKLY
ncbi:trypsin beta-like [Drosophila bipectinata]|uniref:trypsin beta-like n=1 Tax=Drosophila bipectinata TaxID=42026 RepID=UPI001C8B0436|nr:trypsin beta-like [Drosophila bipectinata]